MKKCIPVFVFLFLSACSSDRPPNMSQEATKEALLNDIYEQVVQIRGHEDDQRQVEQPLDEASAEGASLKLFYDGDRLVRLDTTIYGEMGKIIQRYYLDGEELLFVLVRNIHYNKPLNADGFDWNQRSVEDTKHFFYRGKMIGWITPDGSVHEEGEAFAEKEKELLKAFDTYLPLTPSNSPSPPSPF